MHLKKTIAALAVVGSLLTTGVAFAQTTTTTGSSTTPGTPNTGAGGTATANWVVLGATGLVALAGIGYLATRKQGATNSN